MKPQVQQYELQALRLEFRTYPILNRVFQDSLILDRERKMVADREKRSLVPRELGPKTAAPGVSLPGGSGGATSSGCSATPAPVAGAGQPNPNKKVGIPCWQRCGRLFRGS